VVIKVITGSEFKINEKEEEINECVNEGK